jgi:biotin carboxylase
MLTARRSSQIQHRRSRSRHLSLTRVLLLSTTTCYQLRAFNDAAETLGIELLFATDRCDHLEDPWQDAAIPVRFYDPGPAVAAIAEAAAKRPIDGVIAVGDRPMLLAARVAETLDLTWHSVEGAVATMDKRRSRAALAHAGLPSPRFSVVPLTAAVGRGGDAVRPPSAPINFPCVLKPIGLSGSRGVIRANSEGEFTAAFQRIRALLARPQIRAARDGLEGQILVEEYIVGHEYAVEGVMTHGALTAFTIFDKPDPLVGPYFEETIYVTPTHLTSATHDSVVASVERAARALGLFHGPIHAECRITVDGVVYVLEVAGRPIGGLCARVLRFQPGMASLEEVLLRHAVGEPIDRFRRESDAAAVMMIPIPKRGHLKQVQGEEAAREIAGVDAVIITAKMDQLLEPLPEAGSYLGFVFAHGATSEQAENAVRAAHATLQFQIDDEITVKAAGQT